MKKAEIKKLKDAGFLSFNYDRYRNIVAMVKKERRKGKSKLQAIHDTGQALGASQKTVYNAINAVAKL